MDTPEGGGAGRFASTFTVGVLFALAAIPIVMESRTRALREEITDVVEPARALITELQLRIGGEAVAARSFVLTGDSSYVTLYRADQRDRDRAYSRLLRLAPRMGSEIAADARALGGLFEPADAFLSDVMAGRIPPERYVEDAASRQAAFAEASARVARLDEAVSGAAGGKLEAIRAIERIGLAVTSVLVLLAIAAATVVTRLGSERLRIAQERARLLAAERTARLASEEAHREAEARRADLERVTESRAGLMRGFSHDVKNPLGAADGYLELLQDGVAGPVSDRQKEFLARARRALGSALRLIGDLLELARAEAVELEPEAVDLGSLAREMADENRARADAKGLALAAEVQGADVVHTDPTRVRQILGNLLSNAIKYTKEGGVTVVLARHRAELRGRAGPWAVIEVRDTGPGLDPAQQRMLFREFQRLDTAGDGAGIGLAISRRLAHALGGDITVESRVGRGSTFALWLPAEA